MDEAGQEFLRKLRATFRAEAAEHVQTIVSDIVLLERADAAAVDAIAGRILKTLHTLKGAARAVDLHDLELLCHSMEGVCSAWRQQTVAPSPAQFDLLHQACGLVGQLSDQPSGRVRNQAMALVRSLDAISAGTEAAETANAAVAAAPGTQPQAAPAPEPAGSARAPEGMPDPDAIPKAETLRVQARDLDTIRYQAEALLSVELALQHQLAAMQSMAEQLLQRGSGTAADGHSLFEAVRQATGRLHDATTRLGTVRGRLMDTVLDMAMVPFSTLLEHLPGMVRNLARSRGKEAVLTVRGDSVQIDRRILETVREAVLHLVTNAVDHGIEPVEQRLAAGKPAEGQVQITVEQGSAGRVLLTVTDDGAGINVDRVLDAAVRSGSLKPEQLAALDARQRLQLVLRAGVSTSASVTSVSGRGVGLSIVADKVSAVDGQLEVDSQPGRGCRFELSLPVRVATLRALIVRAGAAEYALPLQGLEAVVRLEPGAIATVQGRETISRAGRVLPAVRLAQMLGGEPGEATVAVVSRAGGATFALLVDEVASEQAIVPKSLGKQLRRVRYFSGATQLGTGALLPVLALEDVALHALSGSIMPDARPGSAAKGRARRVLAVEDSITSRLLLKHILEGAGYEVVTAVDGLDAQSRLRREQFDAVVSDVEMPRMDGLTLTRSIRASEKTRDLPVVLVTSLQTAEERERGMQAGADAYVVKGAFDQDNLLATLRRLM